MNSWNSIESTSLFTTVNVTVIRIQLNAQQDVRNDDEVQLQMRQRTTNVDKNSSCINNPFGLANYSNRNHRNAGWAGFSDRLVWGGGSVTLGARPAPPIYILRYLVTGQWATINL